MKSRVRIVSALFLACFFGLASCGDDTEGGGNGGGGNKRPDETGAACEVADDCYPDVAEGDLQGEAVCITRVQDGYCTHTCETDDDCCSAEGECKSSLLEVCSPFESMDGTHCFLSCEDADVQGAGDVADEQEFCQKKASADFICRSSGGGSANRNICAPADCGVGADCDSADDCDPDLECIATSSGGYCTRRGCATNADCGNDVCVTSGGENFCYRPCTKASDCSRCRADTNATCSADVTFAVDGMTGSVCVPG